MSSHVCGLGVRKDRMYATVMNYGGEIVIMILLAIIRHRHDQAMVG